MITGWFFVQNQTLNNENASTVSSKHDEKIKSDLSAIFWQFIAASKNRNGWKMVKIEILDFFDDLEK